MGFKRVFQKFQFQNSAKNIVVEPLEITPLKHKKRTIKSHLENYLVCFLYVSNDMLVNGGVQFTKGFDGRKTAKFAYLFVSRQTMIASPMNNVGQTILIKIWKKVEF